MITGDSRQQVIPPTRTHVKAGFVVYTPGKDERSIIILNDGELIAVDKTDGNRKIVFRMQPGDLVGVASLLEREPFHLTIEASEESDITLVNEECMESELKTLPVWLLAVIKTLSSKTRKLKASLYSTSAPNTLVSFATFCSHFPAKQGVPLAKAIQEFNWLTKIKDKEIQEDAKALVRRRFVEINKVGDVAYLMVPDPFLLELFVDYQRSIDKEGTWAPFSLSILQKKILVILSTVNTDKEMDGPSWLTFLTEKESQFNVGEWIKLQKMGWCTETAKGTYRLNPGKINYFLTALRFETNIRGVL